MSVIDKSLGEDKPIFCSSCGYTPHGCDPCRERLLEDKPPNTIYFRDPYETQDAVPPPNCFDPYEALDEVLVVLAEYREGRLPQFHADRIRSHVRALRAYITGMER